MKLSGHKNNVHENYTHHELEALRKEIQRVPSFLSETAKQETGESAETKEAL